MARGWRWPLMPIISRNENTRSGVAPQTFGSSSGTASMSATVVVPVRDEHLGAVQPGLGVVGIAPAGLGLGDQLEPVAEHLRRRELARHVGVIQMAVRVDQAGH